MFTGSRNLKGGQGQIMGHRAIGNDDDNFMSTVYDLKYMFTVII
jgi:hypothetical protein